MESEVESEMESEVASQDDHIIACQIRLYMKSNVVLDSTFFLRVYEICLFPLLTCPLNTNGPCDLKV